MKKGRSSLSNEKFNKILDLEEREERIIKEIVSRQNQKPQLKKKMSFAKPSF